MVWGILSEGKTYYLFRHSGEEDQLTKYKTARKQFKEICRSSKKAYQDKLREQFRKAACESSRDFWSILKSVVNRKGSLSNEITMQTWYDYFSSL